MSRNEWDVASNAERYVFHLWSMTEKGTKLAIVSPQDVGAHVPTDNWLGRWESVEIPFQVFGSAFRAF